jgi:hypothetical protein
MPLGHRVASRGVADTRPTVVDVTNAFGVPARPLHE